MSERYEGGLSFMSQQVAEAIRSGVDPMSCIRSAATAGEQHRLKETRAEEGFNIIEASKQFLAVTRIFFGNRMGLVELTKRQKIQDEIPRIAKPTLFAETQPSFVPRDVDETCPHI